MREKASDDVKHTGNKYLRTVYGSRDAYQPNQCGVICADVYDILEAFAVTCPAISHAAKKLLCAGLRGKGTAVQDLGEARDAISRAIELAERRPALPPPGPTGPTRG